VKFLTASGKNLRHTFDIGSNEGELMRQDSYTTFSKATQTVSYGVIAVGLFLLFYIGARAFAQINDQEYVEGKPRQQSGAASLGLEALLPVDWESSASMVETVSTVPPPIAQPTVSNNEIQEQPATEVSDVRGNGSVSDIGKEKIAKPEQSVQPNKNSSR
jgi:hypothetical protein